MTFLVALPIRVDTQGDLGEIVPGTHAGAPENHHLKRKALWTTVVAAVLWAISATFILTDWITVADIERWLRPVAEAVGVTSG